MTLRTAFQKLALVTVLGCSAASAFAECEEEGANALAAGCIDFETKPVDLPRLLGKMQAVLGPKTPPAAMNFG